MRRGRGGPDPGGLDKGDLAEERRTRTSQVGAARDLDCPGRGGGITSGRAAVRRVGQRLAWSSSDNLNYVTPTHWQSQARTDIDQT
jgi:hypothetical protein